MSRGSFGRSCPNCRSVHFPTFESWLVIVEDRHNLSFPTWGEEHKKVVRKSVQLVRLKSPRASVPRALVISCKW